MTRRLVVVLALAAGLAVWWSVATSPGGPVPEAAAQVSVPQTTEPPATEPPVTRSTSPPTTSAEPATTGPSTTRRPGTTRPRGSSTTSSTEPAVTTTTFLLPGVVGPVPSTAPPTTSPTNTPSGNLPGWTAVLFWIGVIGATAMVVGQFLRTRPSARRPAERTP